MIKHIIFDLDGVLVDARELHYEALNRALSKHGYAIERDEHLAVYDGLPTRRKLELLSAKKGLPRRLHKEIWQEKQRQTQLVIKEKFVPDQKLMALLDRLSQEGYTISVCSNAVRETVQLMLKKKGLMSRVKFFLSNEDVSHPKPHPEVYLRAFLQLGAAPAECLVVEDSHHGRAAAHGAGAQLCGVAGTAEVTYERIKEAIDLASGSAARRRIIPKWQGRRLRIVIPMAGAGRSFERAGYTFPKPLADVLGKPMVQWVVENMNAEAQYIFVVLREHYEKYNLQYLLNLIAPGCFIVQLAQPTQGAALSVLAAEEFISGPDPLAIVNCDQLLEWNSNEFFYAMSADECDGGLVTFTSTHPKWSYVKTADSGLVTEAAEKKPISNQATAGIYYFARGDQYLQHTRDMIAAKISTNGEYFVCPVYNQYVRTGARIRAFPINKMWSFSTPEDLEFFLQHYDNTQEAARLIRPTSIANVVSPVTIVKNI